MRLHVPYSMRNLIAAAHDTFMAGLSFVLALYLRLGEDQFHLADPYIVQGVFFFTCISLAVFIWMRLYRGLWRFASMPDMVALVKAVSVAIGLFAIMMFAFTRLEGVPRSLPFINWLLLLAMLGGPRFLYRALKDKTLRFDFRHDASKQVPLLLIGANAAAELFIRDSRRDLYCPWRVVGLLDDDPKNRNRSIHGVKIYGGIDLLQVVMNKLERKGLRPQRVIVCGDVVNADGLTSLLEETEALGVTLGRLPSLNEFHEGKETRPRIRPVAIEDLLGRAQTVLDQNGMRELIEGRRVVVTGAGGSIGSELARQICGFSPEAIMLVENSEHALYQIDMEISESHPDLPRSAVLCDVRDGTYVRTLFSSFKPDIVFHAAAVKHVPLSESNPLEAIHTNVYGTRNVADACVSEGVKVMVFISTDKAVHPTNVMGATKRLAEGYCQALGATGAGPRFVTVRFGNVLGSTGSVVPRFRKQLEQGGPITVTHPDMVRYFMTIREAVELVIQAASMGAQLKDRREVIFVLDMGKPVRIVDLANQMIRLAGLVPGQDIEIVYTGLRPGEKLFEELFYDAEKVSRTEHQSILIAAAQDLDLPALQKSLEILDKQCRERDTKQAIAQLKSLVPEFSNGEEQAA